MADLNKVKLTENDLTVGAPLAWAIYGQDDELLLEKSRTLKDREQIDTLLSRGAYRRLTEKEIAALDKGEKISLDSPFNVLDAIRVNLKRVLTDMNSGIESDYNLRVFKIATAVQRLCYVNSDAALGAIILDQNAIYTNVHPVLCAILTELITRRQRIPIEDRSLYIAAALTQNIGMLDLQNQLVNQKEQLTEQQRKAIKEHPFRSKEILKGAGIDHNEWLTTVLHHHERPDGQGYPNSLSGDKVSIYAKIISLSDIYSAMILPRNYRDGYYIKKALQDIFMQRGNLVDENIVQLLIKEIGIYPPGTFVKLANGDTAIVIRRGTKSARSPLVLSITSPRGAFYKRPKQRDTIHKDIYGIVEVVQKIKDLKIDRNQIWGLK